MLKKSINLITPREKEPYIIRRLKTTVPIISAVSLFVFVALFIFSIVYVNQNVNSYNQLVAQVAALENQIEKEKSKEGIYTLTSQVVDVVKQLISVKQEHYQIFSDIWNLQTEGITYTSIIIDQKGKISINVEVDSYEILTAFIEKIVNMENVSKSFSQIRAEGVTRDKKGIYTFTISMQADSGQTRK